MIHIDQELADLAGKFHDELKAKRLRRVLWFLSGYPHKMNKVRMGGETETKVLEEAVAEQTKVREERVEGAAPSTYRYSTSL